MKKIFLLFSVFFHVVLFSQKTTFYTIQHDETIDDVSKIFKVSRDSLLKWNGNSLNKFLPNNEIKIIKNKALFEEEIQFNRNKLAISKLNIKKQSLKSNLDSLISNLKSKEKKLDINNSKELQLKLWYSKERFLVNDSIQKTLGTYDSLILHIDTQNIFLQEQIDLRIKKELRIIELKKRLKEKNKKKHKKHKKKKKKKKKKKTDIIKKETKADIKKDTLNNTSLKSKNKLTDKNMNISNATVDSLGTKEKRTLNIENKKLQDLRDLEKIKADKENNKINRIVFETKIDTNNVSEVEKEKFEKEIFDEKDTFKEERIETDSTIIIKKKIDEVIVKEERKKRYKFGDIVDFNHQEKAKFILLRAKKEIDKGNLYKAKEYIDKSLKLNPSYIDAYILKGDLFASFSYFSKALTQYYKASILSPKDAQLFYNMGNCFVRLGQEKNAIQEWSKAIHVDSAYILAYVGRASIFIKEKRYKYAIRDYNKIFDLNKYFYPAYKGRGVAYLELGNYNEAIFNFNNYLEYEPNNPFILYKRGLAKLYDNEIFGGCTDILTASEMGYKPAEKALKKHCER